MASIITVEKLTKTFGDFTAVNEISFSVNAGEIFAFLGPNGAGKSTTIKMMTTILDSTSGNITIAGYDIRHNRDAVRRSFGIVFQDPSVDDELTAWENMEFHGVLYGVPKELRRKRIDELLKLIELADRKNDLVKTFSGGMRRRLEIARGLIHHPKILYLDEPTIGLDPQTRNHIWNYIKKISKDEGMTVFFTTHHMEEVDRAADRVAIIDHGRIVSTGTPNELKQEAGTQTLEDAFLKITGHGIREDDAPAQDAMLRRHKMWTGRR